MNLVTALCIIVGIGIVATIATLIWGKYCPPPVIPVVPEPESDPEAEPVTLESDEELESFKRLKQDVSNPLKWVNSKGSPDKVAILVGINLCSRYVYQGETLALRGCVYDTIGMKAYAQKMGFGTVYHLTDANATIQTFLNIWQDMLTTLKDGDTVLLHMSRHGMSTGVNLMEGDEEVVVPFEGEVFRGDQAAVMHDGVIIDDCFWRLFLHLPKVKLVYINDSCYSATQFRVQDIVLTGVDQKDKPYRKARAVSKEYLPGKNQTLDLKQLEKAFPKPPSLTPQFSLVSISGSQDHETSADALINDQYQGAFTWGLLVNLNKNRTVTPNQLKGLVAATLLRKGFDQHPQVIVEGDQSLWNQPLF